MFAYSALCFPRVMLDDPNHHYDRGAMIQPQVTWQWRHLYIPREFCYPDLWITGLNVGSRIISFANAGRLPAALFCADIPPKVTMAIEHGHENNPLAGIVIRAEGEMPMAIDAPLAHPGVYCIVRYEYDRKGHAPRPLVMIGLGVEVDGPNARPAGRGRDMLG